MLKIGIFFGGPAREREISFAGGKTAFENIDKSLFEPVPVFIDKCGNFILIKPELLYAASIRDIFPPKAFIPETQYPFSVYVESLGKLSDTDLETMIAHIGKRVFPHDFKKHFQFAFIAMHGPGCEDGSIQGLLEWYSIPYSGPGVMGSAIGIDKIAQNDLIRLSVGLDKKTATLSKDEWNRFSHATLFDQIKNDVGIPFVVKAPHQGSSIGVAFVKNDTLEEFEKAVEQCMFIKKITNEEWKNANYEVKGDKLQRIANLDEGIGFPLVFNGNAVVYHPQALWEKLDEYFSKPFAEAVLTSIDSEDAILIEGFVKGQEFSCGVIQDIDGNAVALPPTEIVKVSENEVFDFNSKYKPGATRKRLPIDTSLENLQKVQTDVKKAFDSLRLGVCTRIDGFLTADGRVILHDPNTIPGMSPTSLIFKQMAEIGLNVCDAITYFIRNSIRERIRTGKHTYYYQNQLTHLDEAIAERLANLPNRKKVAVIFGGFEDADGSYVEARKAYGRLAASTEYLPMPIFMTGTEAAPQFYQVPTNMLFKEYVEDLELALKVSTHPLIAETRQNAKQITEFFVGIFDEKVYSATIETIEKTCEAVWLGVEGLKIGLERLS